MSLIKGMRITERSALPSRAEAFNVFNNVNFYHPGHVQTDGQFGQITAARDPRILPFALQFLFWRRG